MKCFTCLIFYFGPVNAKLLESLPADVTNGTFTWAPSPAVDSPAFKRLQALLNTQDPDPYSCQTNDHAALAILAIAKAGTATAEAIRETVRKISQGSGEKVTDVVEGLKLLAAGKDINYEGASGACDFDEIGDILTCPFRYEVAEAQKQRTLRIG